MNTCSSSLWLKVNAKVSILHGQHISGVMVKQVVVTDFMSWLDAWLDTYGCILLLEFIVLLILCAPGVHIHVYMSFFTSYLYMYMHNIL